MSAPAGTYYDGDYTRPVQHGPAVPFIDPAAGFVQLFRVTFHRLASEWVPLAIGTRTKFNGLTVYLVDEGPPNDSGIAGVLEWVRTYSMFPKPHVEAEPTTLDQQQQSGDVLVELPQAGTAYTKYEYFHTPDPKTIPIVKAYKLAQISGVTATSGQQASSSANFAAAENSIITRWRGNFWRRATPYMRNDLLSLP